MSIYNCEKYLKLILGNNGSCMLNGSETESYVGFPVAGESNAFAVEVVFPKEYKDFAKSAYLSFGDKNYRMVMIENKEAAKADGTKTYYFLLPSAINKGGALGINVAASNDSSDVNTEMLVKWKTFYITVLDAPVTYELNLPADHDLLQYLQEKAESVYDYAERLDEKTIKKDLLNFIPQSFTEVYSGKDRYIQFDGKEPSTEIDTNKQVRLSAVSNNKNGDMTPEMLEKLNSTNDLTNKLGYKVITDVECVSGNGISLNFASKNLKTGNVENISANIPIATTTSNGLMSATDKSNLNKMVVLDDTGRISEAVLPSYVDDVLEFATLNAFPVAGEKGKIYVTLDTNKTYRWSGSSYVEISASLALGETSGTAYRGDRGKIAYDHSQVRGNPHNTSKSEVGLGNVANERQYSAQNMQPYPLGFASADNDFGWGVNIGSPLRVWNEASGGSIGFRKNCPENGKLSIVVDGKVYVDEGQKELATLDSPTFTGAPKVPTPSQSSNDNTVANTAWVKNILNEGSIALYRHRILLSGTNTSVSNAFTLGLIEVYTKSSQPITTVAGVAAALGITGNMELVPVSGCAENGSNHTVLCTEAWVSPSSITLHGMYFGYSSGNGIIERVSTTVTSVSDKVSLVQ